MYLPRTLRHVAVVLALVSMSLASEVNAAHVPDAFLADSTSYAGTSAAVLDVNSDSNLLMELFPLLQAYLISENFRILAHARNINTTSGGPYTVGGVLLSILLSHNLAFLRCIAEAYTCTAEPDPETGGTKVTAVLGTLPAGATETLEVEVQPTEAGPATVSGTLHQDDFDPNEANNTVNLSFNISEPQHGAVHGFKFEDMNGNGFWEEDEPGLNDWTIRLVQETTESTTLTRDIPGYGNGVTTPLETGWYEFLEVAPGDYQVHEDLKDGWVQSAPPNAFYEITIEPNETEGPLEFGNYRPGSIMGSVYEDKDGNGTFGAGDAGISGHTVTLAGTDGMGNAVNQTTTTGTDGTYGFSNLNPGSYAVTSSTPPGLPEVTAVPSGIVLQSGMSVEGADFGFDISRVPRLELTLDPRETQAELGGLETHTASVTNTGTGTATGTTLREHWDVQFFGSAFQNLPPDCSVSFDDDRPVGHLNCDVGDLAPGASFSVDLRFRILKTLGFWHQHSSFVPALTDAVNHAAVTDSAFFIAKDKQLEIMLYREGLTRGRKTAAGDVDVYLDSTLIASAVSPGSATGFVADSVSSTAPMLHVLPAGESDLSAAVLARELELSVGTDDAFSFPDRFVLVLAGDEDVDEAHLVSDAMTEASASDVVAFALVHAAPALGNVEVSSTELGAVPLDPGAVTGYGEVSAGTQHLQIREPVTQALLASFHFDWTNDGGNAFVLVLTDGPLGPEVVAVDAEGVASAPTSSSTEAEPDELPDRVSLHANYPNPFNPFTMIGYALPEAMEVRLDVFDALGRRVATLVDDFRQAGRHESAFDAADLPSGLYVYRLTAGEVVEARTMVVLK